MFDTPADARAQLAQHFTGPQAEIIVAALVPTLVFRPLPKEKGTVGGTRIGGTPDLPPGLAWPRRTLPADMEAIAGRANEASGEEMRRHFRKELPYAFFAQVDLGEARGRDGSAAAALPDQGRLLFFYDLLAGPWDDGTDSVRVIWDESPPESLAAQPMPPDLAAAANAFRVELARALGKPEPTAAEPATGTPYDSPARPMSLHLTLRPPAVWSLEAEADPALKAMLAPDADGGEDVRDSYDELFSRTFDTYYGAANAGRRNQLLGSPLPEQTDPRFTAAAVSRLGASYLDSAKLDAQMAEIEADMRTWRLLLQIDVSDHQQEDSEGTVYFLIRASDLAERRFDRVAAVYQQT